MIRDAEAMRIQLGDIETMEPQKSLRRSTVGTRDGNTAELGGRGR
jgi:hypothetical protein